MRVVPGVGHRIAKLGVSLDVLEGDLRPPLRKSDGTLIESAVLTPEHAAMYLAVGPTTLYHLTRGGRVRSLKIGRSRRYRKQDLDSYLESLLTKTA